MDDSGSPVPTAGMDSWPRALLERAAAAPTLLLAPVLLTAIALLTPAPWGVPGPRCAARIGIVHDRSAWPTLVELTEGATMGWRSSTWVRWLDRPAAVAGKRTQGGATARRFRRTLWSALQALRIKLWLALVGRGLFRFRIEVAGLEHIPRGEPLIVAAGPHRSWIDSLLLLTVLPPLPRTYFLAAVGLPGQRQWKLRVINIAGGMVPVATSGQLNREGLELALAILAHGNRVGIFPEGWGPRPDPEVMPLKRGVAFLSAHSGRRVLPVALAGANDLWRGKTLRVQFAPPLPALEPGADRQAQQAYVDRLRAVLQEVAPAPPPEPPDSQKRWRWLTRLV
jgi:1-acyl-sn-glycerol-3-phosphate acyltransferase